MIKDGVRVHARISGDLSYRMVLQIAGRMDQWFYDNGYVPGVDWVSDSGIDRERNHIMFYTLRDQELATLFKMWFSDYIFEPGSQVR